MADRIKGITIEIGGDTTKLTDALKKTNTSLKQTQSSLKDVNKLLKFDPGNTTLLAQKQEYLKKAIDDTKEKLKQEKEALEQLKANNTTGEATEQQKALERQVADTEQRLKSLTDQSKEFGSVATQQFKVAGDKIAEVGTKLQNVGAGMTKYITAPIAAVGAASVVAFNEVDAGFDTIIQKTGASGENLEAMQQSMEEIATTIPTGFDEAGAAVGEVNTRFGLMGDDLTNLSSKFIQFAQLNGTDVSGSIDKVQSSMAAFGLGAEDAENVLDILNKAGQDTGVSMDALASSLTTNGTALQEAGFSFEQSAGFLANLNKNGIDSSAVMTGLKKALQNATKEGKPLDEALAELQEKMKSAATDTEAMQMATELFGAKAGPQLAAALKEGRISLDASANSIENWGDSVDKTFDATLDAPDKLKMTFNELKIVGADLGGTLLEMVVPALEKLSEIVHAARDAWEGLDEGQKKMIITIAGVVAAIGPVVSIIGSIMTVVGPLISAIGAVVGVLGGPLTLALAAAIAAGIAIATHWDQLKEAAGKLADTIRKSWDGIKAKAGELATAVGQKFDEIKTAAQEKWRAANDAVSNAMDTIKTKVSDGMATVKEVAAGYLQQLVAEYEKTGGGLSGAIEAAMTTAKQIFDDAYAYIDQITHGKLTEIVEAARSILDGLKAAFQEKFDAAKQVVTDAVEFFKNAFNFEWKLPDLKLPHFTVKGEFSLNPPSVPSFGIDWYSKAMQNGMVLNGATIFGMMNGRLLGAGEAGSETVVGTQSLMNMIKSAVGETINYGGINVVVYGAPGQDVEELADIISDRINAQVAARKAVFA